MKVNQWTHLIGNVNSLKFETVHTIFPSLSQTVAPGPNIRSQHNYAVFTHKLCSFKTKDNYYSLNFTHLGIPRKNIAKNFWCLISRPWYFRFLQNCDAEQVAWSFVTQFSAFRGQSLDRVEKSADSLCRLTKLCKVVNKIWLGKYPLLLMSDLQDGGGGGLVIIWCEYPSAESRAIPPWNDCEILRVAKFTPTTNITKSSFLAQLTIKQHIGT